MSSLLFCSVHSALAVSLLITITGKGNEDKRGIPVTHDVYSKSWLYVNGQPVVCNRHMEVRVACQDFELIIERTVIILQHYSLLVACGSLILVFSGADQ